ncbi:MAG: hypothetical protein ACD_58C00288G0006 [uncultured bacterium]|nr:MAG: hypothetical protein ACD_58C00288G0006 [uncultured bacterium]
MNIICKKLERVYKGVANHRRIEIMFLIDKHNELSLNEISELIKCNLKTISEHTKRLYLAGLVNKRHYGNNVLHSLSPYGDKIYATFKLFLNSQEFENRNKK